MKTWKKILIVYAIIILIFVLFFVLFLHYVLEIGRWRGKSVDKYYDVAYSYFHDIPNNASDFKFKCENLGVSAYSMAAFNLEGQDYLDYIKTLDEKDIESRDDYNLIGKQVKETKDCYDSFGEYCGFPKRSFEYVIDDDIDEYVIVYYHYTHAAGSRTVAAATNPNTRRIVLWTSGYN